MLLIKTIDMHVNLRRIMMNWKNFVLITFSVFLFSCASLSEKKNAGQQRPNILLITSDDNGPHLSCYGDQYIQTPHLDAIAKNGVLFRNGYITESVCSPSRSSILTGLYPHQSGHLGLTTHGFHFVGDITTIYQQMKNAGYRTGMLGKLHVDPESYFPIEYWPLKEPNYQKKNLARYANYAGEFMNQSDTPFFLMVNFPDPHWPFNNVVEGRPANPVKAEDVASFPYIGVDNERIRRYTTGIYNGILRLDECIGELMGKLKESGKLDNTLVIYLSDHGDEMARGKFDIYEAATNVPFLVSWPKALPKGVESNALISSVDIVPTILDAAGISSVPPGVTGKSLLPVCKKPDTAFRDYLFTEKNCDEVDMYYPRRAVRDQRYKLIYSLLDGKENMAAMRYITAKSTSPVAGAANEEELKNAPDSIQKAYHDWRYPNKVQLYDLQNDPYEFHDLSEDPRYADIKKRLMDRMVQWQEETDDPFRFPDKLKMLTHENDTIKVSKHMKWQYPHYLYGK